MTDLSKLTTEELEDEIKRRKDPPVPDPVADPDWSAVVRMLTEHVRCWGDRHFDEHYVYEAAMEAVFGRDIWDWVNAKFR